MVDMLEIASGYYAALPPGPPLQGDVWTNLPLPYHEPSYGPSILITPACDFVHDKAPLVNYLSLVALQEYFETVGSFQLLEQELHQTEDTVRAQPPNPSMAALLEIGVSPEQVLSEVECTKTVDAASSRRLEKFRGGVEKIRALKAHLHRDRIPMSELLRLVPQREVRSCKERIVKNQISDVHFLPPYSLLLPEPSVLLLRCIASCDIRFLRLAYACPTAAVWRRECETRKLNIPALKDDPPKPERILRLRSPHLECLMARIGALFGRIGVPDLPRSAVAAFIGERS